MTETESGLGGSERDYGEEALVMIMGGGGIITLDARYRDKLTRRLSRGEGFGFSRALHLYVCVERLGYPGTILGILFWYKRAMLDKITNAEATSGSNHEPRGAGMNGPIAGFRHSPTGGCLSQQVWMLTH